MALREERATLRTQVRDLSGTELVASELSLRTVTNKTPPAFSSAAVDGDELEITFDGDLATDAGSLPAGTDFAEKATRSGTERDVDLAAADPVVSGLTVTLTLAEAVLRVDTLTVGYTPGTNTLKDSDNAMEEVPGFSAQAVTNDTPADTDPPEFVSAAVNGTALTVTFDEVPDPSYRPNLGVVVTQGGATVSLSHAGVEGSHAKARLLAAATHGQSFTVAYTDLQDPFLEPNGYRDLSGNKVASFAAQTVTNNTPPAFSSAAVYGDELEITFNGCLDTGSEPDAGDFAVTVAGEAAALADTNPVSDATAGLTGAEGAASRLRLMLVGSGTMRLWNGTALRPTLQAGLRHDGGDAETGAGVEIGGGLAYSAGRLAVQVDARALLAHQDADYEESGYSVSMKWQPGEDGRGLSMNLGSSWGQVMSGVQAMWSGRAGAGLARGMARGAGGALAQRFETELGYGFVGRKARGLWTPFLAAESGDGNAAYRLGLKLSSAANAEAAFEFGRRESVGGPPDDEVRLQGRIRW